MILKLMSEWIGQVILLLIFPITFSGAGATLLSPTWTFYGAVLGMVVSFLVARFSDRGMVRILGASEKGMSTSWRRSLASLSLGSLSEAAAPEILVYPDPFPQVWLVRGLFRSRGVVLISQGLMSSLKEEDLRVLLRQMLIKMPACRTALLSYDSFLLLILLKGVPAGWVELLFSKRKLNAREEELLSPLRLLGFSLVFPLLRLLIWYVVEGNGRHLQDRAESAFGRMVIAIQNTMGPWQNSLSLRASLGGLGKLPEVQRSSST